MEFAIPQNPDLDAFMKTQEAKYAHVRMGEIGQMIKQLGLFYADKVRLPSEETELYSKAVALMVRLEDAAIRAPKESEQAIRHAIHCELNRILNDYGLKG